MAAVMLVGSITLTTQQASAQLAQYNTQHPVIYAAGSFNNGTDTSAKAYVAPTLITNADTVVLAATANDSAWVRLAGQYYSVTLQANAAIYSGTSCDSVTVNFWGSAMPGNGTGIATNAAGAFKLLQTSTLTASTSEQVFTYLPASGMGNPYTNYRITVDVADLAGACAVRWRGVVLVR